MRKERRKKESECVFQGSYGHKKAWKILFWKIELESFGKVMEIFFTNTCLLENINILECMWFSSNNTKKSRFSLK